MLQTLLTQAWGCRYPIINASMTPAATGNLARAVSQAGGFGMIGVNESWREEDVRRECAAARQGDRSLRFGVGFFGWALERSPELLDVAVAQRPFLISISFIDVAPYAARIKSAGILLAAQVQTRRDAELALRSGVDFLIAQGTEAGGHTGDVSTLTMLQIALSISDKPVLAAGGIATPQGLAGVLAAGAVGAWIGTPFLLAREANVSEAARQRIIESDETQTVLTTLFDRLQGYPWPERFKGRALRNQLTDRWHGSELAALANPHVIQQLDEAKRNSDFRLAYIYAGQSVGLLSTRCYAADIVRSLGDGAEQVLRKNLPRLLGGSEPG